jgi:hypothetical protein
MPEGNPPWKARKREGTTMPEYQTLGERMTQGSKYSGGPVKHGLDAQMSQGTKGYKRESSVKKLRDLMGQ